LLHRDSSYWRRNTGSDGGEGQDEIGGADFNDVFGALQLIKSLDYETLETFSFTANPAAA
jgi:hypothetical protein